MVSIGSFLSLLKLTFNHQLWNTLIEGKVRHDVPPQMESISYTIEVDTDEPEHRLALLHESVKKYGTVFNTVAPGTDLSGWLVRKKR